MARPNSGPRLIRFKSNGSKEAYWYIQWYEDGRKWRRSTGVTIKSDPNSEIAQEIFQGWLAERAPRPEGANRAHELLISDALDLYGEHHGKTIAAPDRIAYAMDPLLTFFAGKVVAFINAEACRAYNAHRATEGGVKDSTVRRELGVLCAALNWCAVEGYLLEVPRVWKPPSSPPKDRWLTRQEVARLIRAARNIPICKDFIPIFVLIAVYTCTRKTAILNLQWEPNIGGGWVDIERSLIYRKSESQIATNKRQTPAPIPPRLERFLKPKAQYVVAHEGLRVVDPKRAFKIACAAAGLKGVTLHTLRHTGITWLVQTGVPLWEVAGFAGCSVETVERTYAHHAPDYMERAKNALNRSPSAAE